ncbi:MAG: hypothetical protein AAGA03_16095 [Planctomycetota bacterium]
MSRARAVATMVSAVLLAWSPLVYSAGERSLRLSGLAKQYPYESLESRVRSIAEPVVMKAGFAPIPESLDWKVAPHAWRSRTRAIRALHRSAVAHFLGAPEIGVGRMIYPNFTRLNDPTETPVLLSEIAAGETLQWQSGNTDLAAQIAFRKQVDVAHERVSNWFVPVQSIGDFREVTEVAGFQPHAITRERLNRGKTDLAIESLQDVFQVVADRGEDKGQAMDYALTRLQLLGLLYHDQPIVYDLETLPDLAAAEDAPVRPINAFESRGLERLIDGIPVHVEQSDDRIQVLGALRNAESCTRCHDGSSDRLLGAFSYNLVARRSPESK